ncbi:MAG: tyrosine-type recombinase/integrase [Bacteroidales bacterium]|nr:tyrosine-type recombinase/integrase [Bacteroidales bacterium]
MCLPFTCTTADAMDWDEAMDLVRNLYRDGNYTMSLLVATGCFTGLRVSDILSLRYSDLFSREFEIIEKKTRKRRTIRVNADLREHALRCFKASGLQDASRKVFISRKKTVFSIQRINVIFKELKEQYGLQVGHFSTHSMRKTFGRRVVKMSGADSEMALIKLSDIFQHSSVMTTRIYLGLRKEELLDTYDLLSM